MATVLIKNGRIVTAVDDYLADILIEDGRIRTIGQGLVVGNN
jgi:dihydropyrimidinase